MNNPEQIKNVGKIEQKGEYEFEVESGTSKGKIYTVMVGDGQSCECQGFVQHKKPCKHIAAVLDLINNEQKKEQQDSIPKKPDKPESPKPTPGENVENGKFEIGKPIKLKDIPSGYIHLYKFPEKDEYGNKTGKTTIVPHITIEGLKYLYAMTYKKPWKRLDAEMVVIPCKENDYMVIFKCTLEDHDGNTTTGHGDAIHSVNLPFRKGEKWSPPISVVTCNVGPQIKKHYIRMGETRSIARVLRSVLILPAGMIAVEEMESGAMDVDEPVLGAISPNQLNAIKTLLSQTDHKWNSEESLIMQNFVCNLTVGEATEVITELEKVKPLDFDKFVTIKDNVVLARTEVKNEPK